METLQLSVLDLPPVNPLGLLPRFAINEKEAEAIAEFATIMGELRLDQLPDDLAGHGRNEDHKQPNLPIALKINSADVINYVSIDEAFLDKTKGIEICPEKLKKPVTHGYVEPYEVFGANKKPYSYTRYTYRDERGKLKHHHIPDKQAEAIAAMWHDGATEKEICNALGKECKLE